MHWLDQYGPECFRWHTVKSDEAVSYYRRIGVAEGLFDLDGIYLEGRADCHSLVTLKTSYEPNENDVLRTWAYFRLKHAMLMAKAVSGSTIPGLPSDNDNQDWRYFHITPPSTHTQALDFASSALTFVAETYPTVSTKDFHHHVLNSSRVIDPAKSLSHLFVLPTTKDQASGTYLTTFLLINAHCTTDGLTMFAWCASFVSLFSTSVQSSLTVLLSTQNITSMRYHLHPAQESLYPPVYPSRPARARWTWAITRVLRHIARPIGKPFPDPLLNPEGRAVQPLLQPSYLGVLDYSRPPPISTRTTRVSLSIRQTAKLKILCKDVNATVGAGVFALLAIASMRCRELLNPHELQKASEGRAEPDFTDEPLWITGFPLDCRSFLSVNVPYEGMTLGFSWGQALPFLGSDIPFKQRFRVLARAANRQLGVYQKGERGERGGVGLGLRGRDQTLRALYLTTAERLHGKLPAEIRARRGENGWKCPQGDLGAWVTGGFTHEISNWGSLPRFLERLEDRREMLAKDKSAEMVDFQWSLRAREGEFLVGVAENLDGSLLFCVNFDAGAMELARIEVWTKVVGSLLDTDKEV